MRLFNDKDQYYYQKTVFQHAELLYYKKIQGLLVLALSKR